jgi:aromatic ring-cleaving dioxygenase
MQDFTLDRSGPSILIHPNTRKAARWLRDHCAEDLQGHNSASVDRATYQDLRILAMVDGFDL